MPFFPFQTFLAGAKGFVYALVDPRGTGFQGDRWRHSVHHAFGTVEVTSTLEVAKYLQKNLPYVDEDRFAFWGWSYGGFLSLSVLGQDTGDVFK